MGGIIASVSAFFIGRRKETRSDLELILAEKNMIAAGRDADIAALKAELANERQRQADMSVAIEFETAIEKLSNIIANARRSLVELQVNLLALEDENRQLQIQVNNHSIEIEKYEQMVAQLNVAKGRLESDFAEFIEKCSCEARELYASRKIN